MGKSFAINSQLSPRILKIFRSVALCINALKQMLFPLRKNEKTHGTQSTHLQYLIIYLRRYPKLFYP